MQVKKREIREAILEAAFDLFSRRGYAATTVPQIAERAGVSTTNCYVYFDSKLAILYAVHEPWIQRQFEALQLELAKIVDPQARLRRLFIALFRELPAREGGFANNIMQAIATARPGDRYRPSLMSWLELRMLDMLADALPHLNKQVIDRAQLAHFLMLAFDGHIVYHHIARERGCPDRTIDLLCELFGSVSTTPAGTSPRRRRPRLRAV